MRVLQQKRNGNGLGIDARLELGASMKTKSMLQKPGVVAGFRGRKRILRYFHVIEPCHSREKTEND